MTRYRERLPVPGRVRRAGGPEHACGGARVSRAEAAPRRRDREVRARHLLLQRRRGAGVGGGDADPGPLTSRRPELRPEARDVCSRGRADGCATRSASDYAFAVVNFANPDMVGHTGSIPAVVAAVEATDRALGRVVDVRPRSRWSVFGDGGPRECRGHARGGRRQPAHGAYDESRAARRHGRARRACARKASCPTSHPRS